MTPRRWKLVVAASAERTLARLPEKSATAVVELILGPLSEVPKQVDHALERELEGLWAARRGPYRVVYALDEEEHHIEVVRIDHRADVYRPR